eukprot:1962384-Pleurochrysis_carterae.AAC.1
MAAAQQSSTGSAWTCSGTARRQSRREAYGSSCMTTSTCWATVTSMEHCGSRRISSSYDALAATLQTTARHMSRTPDQISRLLAGEFTVRRRGAATGGSLGGTSPPPVSFAGFPHRGTQIDPCPASEDTSRSVEPCAGPKRSQQLLRRFTRDAILYCTTQDPSSRMIHFIASSGFTGHTNYDTTSSESLQSASREVGCARASFPSQHLTRDDRLCLGRPTKRGKCWLQRDVRICIMVSCQVASTVAEHMKFTFRNKKTYVAEQGIPTHPRNMSADKRV